MKEKVLKTIKKYNLIENRDKIVLGVSGGPDSLCMLNILNEIKNDKEIDFDLIIAHINHMIREEAQSDEEFVKEFCQKLQIKCYIKRIDVKKYANNNKIGLEEAGRKVRYDFFDEVMQKENANKIAIAHNKNDKAETIIMNILRGSGPSGLKGIEPKRNNKYIRPIIELTRDEIETYCEQKKLNPRIDKTNFINDCTRNKIRNIVLPYIKKEFNPNIVETINRLSSVVIEEDDFIQKITKQEYSKILIEENQKEIILDLKEFNKQENVIKKRLIIYTISRLMGNSKNIEKVHIEDIIKLCSNNIGNKFLTPNKNIKVLIKKQKIFISTLI